MASSQHIFNAMATFNEKHYVIGRFSRDYICLKDIWDSVLFQSVGLKYMVGEKFKQEVTIPWEESVREIGNDNDLLEILDEFEARKIQNIHFTVYYLAPTVILSEPTPLPILGIDQESNPDLNLLPEVDPIQQPIPNPIQQPILDPFPESISTSTEISGNDTESINFSSLSSSDEEFTPHLEREEGESEERGFDGSSDELSDVDDQVNEGNGGVFTLGDNGRITLRVGQLFRNVDHFRKTILDYSIQEGFKLKRIKNEKGRVTSGCLGDGCPWRVHGSPTFDGVTYGLKSLRDEHTCLAVSGNRDMTSIWIGERFQGMIKDNPDISISVLGAMILRQYGVTVPSYTLYRAKKYALDIGEEDHKESYNKLYRYGQTVRDLNPGSSVFISVTNAYPDANIPSHFNRFFISFNAQKMGFLEGCRPFIGLDGCHLKGRYGGILLCAIGLDANCGVYPIGLGVVEIESLDSWKWFLQLLYEHLGMPDDKMICFMSDRQKGIVPALESIWPNHTSRFCGRHILANMLSKYKIDYLKELFWPAARASNQSDFVEAMEKIRETSEKAWEYLSKIRKERWTVHAFDHTTKSDHITNNVVEAFNGWLNKVRALPMLTMLERIRVKIMKRSRERYDNAVQWDSDIPPQIKKLVQKIQQRGRFLDPIRCDTFEFQVTDNTRQHVVHLDKRLCSCGYWPVSGVPCMHAMACITRIKRNVEDFLDDYLKRAAYLSTYRHVIHALPDETLWSNGEYPKVLPPLKRNRPGRPKLSRNRTAEEPDRVRRSVGVRCGKCKQIGHNSRTCRNEPLPKKQRTGTGCVGTSAGEPSTVGTSAGESTAAGASSSGGTVTRVLWYGHTTSSEPLRTSQTINPSAPPSSQSIH